MLAHQEMAPERWATPLDTWPSLVQEDQPWQRQKAAILLSHFLQVATPTHLRSPKEMILSLDNSAEGTLKHRISLITGGCNGLTPG